MAKKGHRQLFLLVCSECEQTHYITEKNKINTPDKLQLEKFCSQCRKRTPHKEKSRLK